MGRRVAAGTCVQSASDRNWYVCKDGAWLGGTAGCTVRYPWCQSDTLGRAVAPRTCVESRFDGSWHQCGAGGWVQPVASGAGPAGACSAMHER